MTKTRNPLRLALEDVLGPAGFSRKGDSWLRRTDEVVEVVNLQKSQYGNQYYLNYGLWLCALGEDAFPKEEKCHIRMRAGAIVSSEAQLGRLADLESIVSDSERRAGFARLITDEFLPFADACRTVSGLRSFLEAGRLKKAMVHVRAKATLSRSST
ncbi:MAG: DUF4304 domain-containing protein [Planctomycetota bacterium]